MVFGVEWRYKNLRYYNGSKYIVRYIVDIFMVLKFHEEEASGGKMSKITFERGQ